ncbi:major facilitator superfamily domain-containing protein [Xylaria bambusicola]|uniref:major facilitator superfamily domain-containing protein n=1 Tax=Xylaria bambusicola TaxID=326684 RepID=UPI0020080F45|nr:major facilitator superfamily domain-containing protein [Xylaria bambusicola]KAI0506141.1 major facilitator superfamily domain-containing protein [Xylaria bambusicola]
MSSQTESTSLRELSAPDNRLEPVTNATQGDGDGGGDESGILAMTSDPRQTEASRKRALILLGASISQLPIWGFSMSYGVFQEYYLNNWTLAGSRDATGIIGTTSNGVVYLSIPFLSALFTRRWARHRRTAAVAGTLLAALSFALSSLSAHVWHLVATQGVLAAIGSALVYSPTTLSLGEWFSSDAGRKNHRAVAYGVTLSCKNVVGSVMPFLARALLENYGFRVAVRIWAAVALGTSLLSIFLIPTHPNVLASTSEEEEGYRRRYIPWNFLRHRTFYVYAIAIILQSAGYGIPQSYLPTYAREVTQLSQTSATLLLTVFNIPGILASSLFGYLSDNRYFPLSATTVTAISALCSALAAFLLWGLTSQGSLTLLLLFSITFGFFAGGYSATWGGVINELESEAARWNEAVDPGMLYGLLNGARGIGYVSGGLLSVPLLKAGSEVSIGGLGYSSTYGPLILFTGLSSVFGGWGILWRWTTSLRRLL